MGKLGLFLFAICVIVGLYFLNSALSLIALPSAFNVIDTPLKIIGAILLVVGGFFMIKLGKKKLINPAYSTAQRPY